MPWYVPTLFYIIKNQLISAQAQCYYIFQQFEARNVLILFLTVMYFLMAENQLKRLWVLLYTVFLVVWGKQYLQYFVCEKIVQVHVYVQDASFQWHGWLLLRTKVTNTCIVSTPICCVMLTVLACCVSPSLFSLNLFFLNVFISASDCS